MLNQRKETESEIKNVTARQVNFELEMTRLESIMNKVHKNMHKIREMEKVALRAKTVRDQGVIDAAWVEVASKQVDAKLGKVENEVREMNKTLLEARVASAESQDKEARRNNIILCLVPDSVIFVTKIKTRTRIIGRRFQRTRTRIIVIRKTKTK